MINALSDDSKKLPKNMTKWIDPWRGAGIGSARRHDGGRPRDRMSIAVLTFECNHPIGFLVPSKQAL